MIESFKQRHELYLQHLITTTIIPAERIKSALEYSLFPGGKRMRPVLIYLAGQLLDTPLEILDVLAAAMELTHCYSLIHDDLPAMDDDDFRRGKLSCHKAYDEATAILTGDGMQVFALELLLTQLSGLLHPQQIINIAKALTHASGISGMVSGQSLDLSELAQTQITESQLRTIHLLKTGKLISACFFMVLATQNSTDPQIYNSLTTYAQHLGLVFQMQDDYLDKYATNDTLGKGRSSDTINQKTTFASLMTEKELKLEISKHYQLALDCLHLFGDKAQGLRELTEQLKNRS